MINTGRSFFLLFGAEGAFLLPPASLGGAEPLFAAHHDKNQWQTLRDELSAAPRRGVVILYDGAALSVQRESLPPLSPWDRRALLARRLEAAFAGRAFLSGAAEVKDRAATLIAIGQDPRLSAWLDEMAARETFSQSVVPLPLDAPALLHRLAPQTNKEGWACLLTYQQTGGYRASVTQGGALVFTRLLPPAPQGGASKDLAAFLAREIKALRDYLSRKGLRPDKTLTVLFLAQPDRAQALGAALRLPNTNLLTLTPHEAARRLSLPLGPAKDEDSADALLALWARSRPLLPCRLMTDTARRTFHENLIRSAGLAAAGLLLIIALGQTALDAARLIRQTADLTEVTDTIGALKSEYKALQKEEEASDGGQAALMRIAAERRRLFQNEPPALLTTLQAVNAALARQSQAGNEASASDLHYEGGTLRLALKLMDPPLPQEAQALSASRIAERMHALQEALRAALPPQLRMTFAPTGEPAQEALVTIEGREPP